MLKIENFEVMGWEHAIRGMRNPMNSWERSDSAYGCYPVDPHTFQRCDKCDVTDEYFCKGRHEFNIGPIDQNLMKNLRDAGTDHRKFMRMITVYLDITAPLYWWKEFDTYKVGTVANSCSTMHKIAEKEFTMDDFSCEQLLPTARKSLKTTIDILNEYREHYNVHTDPFVRKIYWWQMIQLLPSSYNQKRTVMLNYEVLANIYKSRKDHKLDEWRTLCHWIEELPYSELITGLEEKDQ